MKNHIAFKFAAVVLAALLLLSAVGSGLGILVLSNYDLYNQTWEEGYEDNMRNIREGFAQALVFRFASMELGGCSTPLIDDYYGNGALYTSFRWGRYAYTVRSKNDQEIMTLDREIPDAEHFVIPVENGRFVYLISEKDVEETTAERLQQAEAVQAPTETAAPVTVPAETAEETAAESTVSKVTDETAGETTAEAAEETAAAETKETAAAETAAAETAAAETAEAEATEATAAAEETAAVTEAETATAAAAEETAAAETTGEAEETAATEETKETAEEKEADPPKPAEPLKQEQKNPEENQPAEETKREAPPPAYRANPYFTRDQYEEAFSYPYYNYESGTMKDATLCYANTSDYTVDLYLAPDALYDYQMWNLLEVLAPMRGQLFAILGGSLLFFAVLMAYIFCAAGRKPVTGELEPMGFNLMPLDLYTVLLVLGAAGCVWLAVQGMALFKNTQMIQLIIAGGACFLGCLLLICYSMSWAAQLKQKEKKWIRNTLVFRALSYGFTGCVWLLKHLAVWAKHTPELAAWLREHALQPAKVWIHKILQRMPTMYQWLACTGVVLLLLLLAFLLHSTFLMILSILAFAALTVYGGWCFSLLLTGVRRMRAGELKTKVESRMLVGSMQEFAQELNGLANVAGEAADKQLKSERMKTELITNVSHDIKTPLTSIINYVDLLERPHSQKEQEEYLEVLSRQSLRLKKLIDDLMEMSKASTGNMQTDITVVNAAEAINQCLGEFTDKLMKADLIPVFHVPDHDITMKADGRLVWRVMSNLLGNVVKYALPGTRVYVDLNEIRDNVIISVKNVSREELNVSSDELMERFVRGDASRNTEGSGLGLNIAKSLMELQHGQMELLVDGDLFKVTLIFPKNGEEAEKQ